VPGQIACLLVIALGPLAHAHPVGARYASNLSAIPIYAATGQGYVYGSYDKGRTWQERDSFGVRYAFNFLGPFAVAPSRPTTVYFVGGVTNPVVLRSYDSGATWTAADQGPDEATSIAVDPRSPTTVFAAGNGLFRSTDGAGSWTRLPAPGTPDLVALAFQHPATLLVADNSGPVSGAFRSTDSGAHWTPVGLAGIHVNQLVFSYGTPSIAYAATTTGLYRSTDNGHMWSQPASLPSNTRFTLVVTNPRDTHEVVAYTYFSTDATAASSPGYDTIYHSMDGGSTWLPLKAGLSRLKALVFDPSAPDTLIGAGRSLATATLSGTPIQVADLPTSDPVALGTGRQPLPTDPQPAPSDASARYFSQTCHTLSGAFLRFWSTQGGVSSFGLPISEQFTEGGQTVQYLERAAFVLHGATINLLPLGRVVTTGRTFPAAALPVPRSGTRYFPATQHTVSGRFLEYWLAHNGATLLGAPISEAMREANSDGTGKLYLLQYFENGRLEFHPEIATVALHVQGGQVGREALQLRGWL
jgi:photosystem II stability/assembly factor-like uncharacterized protein